MLRVALLALACACGPDLPAPSSDAGVPGPLAAPPGRIERSPELCREWLTASGVDWRVADPTPGISDPVTVEQPIAGIAYRSPDDWPRPPRVMDCELALALARSAAILRRHDVAAVRDLGVYSYRCVANEGTPPQCPHGLSRHARGLAIDVAAYVGSDGVALTVSNDWAVDDGSTCGGPWNDGPSGRLHAILCDQVDAGLWSTVLTPNYNDGHRDHFHLDRGGGDFVRRADADDGPVRRGG